MNAILITGCSSGFGLETARYFLDRDWRVVAAMRTPREDVLPRSDRLHIVPLDVTSADSIQRAVDRAGPIDALVNNAGIGLLNALEGVPVDTIREVFETNTFGAMAMAQAVLPQFRHRRAGVIVNVTSSVTLKPLPLLSIYTASKAAVNAFTESLQLELQQFGIRVALVIPGQARETGFGAKARARTQGSDIPAAYADLAKSIFAKMSQPSAGTTISDVAAAVWRAVTDPHCPMHLPAGADAVALAAQG